MASGSKTSNVNLEFFNLNIIDIDTFDFLNKDGMIVWNSITDLKSLVKTVLDSSSVKATIAAF